MFQYFKTEDKAFKLLIILLIGLCLFCFWEFLTFEKIYFLIASDGRESFLPNLKNLHNILFSGEFPMWSFCKGLGQNITTGNPNMLGDIFSFFSALLPEDKIMYSLGWVYILKIFLSGILFYMYLTELNMQKNTKVIFSLLYAFNGHMLVRGPWMHYATEVVMVVPWLIGMEKWCKNRNFIVFPIAFALLLVSRAASYAYLYTILTFAYIFFREIYVNGFSFKKIIKEILYFLPMYLLGLGLSAVLLLPGLYNIINSGRTSGVDTNIFGKIINSFRWESLDYISSGILKTFSPNVTIGNVLEDTCFYSGIITLFFIPHIFINKNIKVNQKIVAGVIIIAIIFYGTNSFLKNALNAFTMGSIKTTSFWITISLIILGAIDFDKSDGKCEKYAIIPMAFLFMFMCASLVYNEYRKIIFIIYFGIIIAYYIILSINWKKYKIKQILIIGMVVIEAFVSIKSVAIPDSIISGKVTRKDFNELFGPMEPLSNYKPDENDFYRVGINNVEQLFRNSGLIYDYYGVSVYDSLTPNSVKDFVRFLNIEQMDSNTAAHAEDNYYANEVLNVKYMLYNDDSADVLKGYKLVDSWNDGEYKLYENENFLPLGLFYSNVQDKSEIENAVDKDRYLLYGAILNSDDINKLNLPLVNKNEMTINDNKESVSGEIATPRNVSVTELNEDYILYTPQNEDPQFEYLLNSSETGDLIINLTINSPVNTQMQIFYAHTDESFSQEKSIFVDISEGEKQYIINLNNVYECGRIRFDLGNIGNQYSVKDINIECLNKDDSSQINYLKENAMTLTKFSNNQILGEIEAKTNGILYFSIPFTGGWRVFVDGEEQELLNVNIGFSGVYLEEGQHNIELVYFTPWLKAGILLTLISLAVFITLIYLRRKLINKSKNLI